MENLNNKISAKQYVDNNDLLEVSYVTYEDKVRICDIVLSQVVSDIGYVMIDSALLERVSTQIFIENLTNIDMDVLDENGLSGYDTLCYYDELEYLVEILSDFDRMKHILNLKVEDFYRNQGSLKGYLHTLRNYIVDKVGILKDDISETIQSLDSKEISEKIIKIIKDNTPDFK